MRQVPIRSVAVAASALGLGAPNALAVGPSVSFLDVTPTSVVAPGTVTARFVVTGGDTDGHLGFTAQGSAPAASLAPYAGAAGTVGSLAVTSVSMDGPATAEVLVRPAIAFAPTCARGGVNLPHFTDVLLDVPAHSSTTLTYLASVPTGFTGQPVALDLVGSSRVYGAATPVLASAPVTRTAGFVDGVSLSLTRRKHGRVTATGTLLSGRAKARVQIVAASAGLGSQSLVPATGVLAPLGSTLTRVATVTTGAGGRFHVSLKANVRTAIAARVGASAGLGAGASCPVVVRK